MDLPEFVSEWMHAEAHRRAVADPEAIVPGPADHRPGAPVQEQLAAMREAERRLTAPPDRSRAPRSDGGLKLRPATTADLVAITHLLHRAYAPLAARNLRYVATHQAPDVTAARMARGRGFVGELSSAPVATVTYVPPERDGGGDAFFARAGVAKFAQLAVDPPHKGRGLGGQLLDFVERLAVADGAAEIALDTAVPATDLRDLYRRRGYRHVGYCDYRPDTNYPSVVMSKKLSGPR